VPGFGTSDSTKVASGLFCDLGISLSDKLAGSPLQLAEPLITIRRTLRTMRIDFDGEKFKIAPELIESGFAFAAHLPIDFSEVNIVRNEIIADVLRCVICHGSRLRTLRVPASKLSTAPGRDLPYLPACTCSTSRNFPT
jgi:hypothetical protein